MDFMKFVKIVFLLNCVAIICASVVLIKPSAGMSLFHPNIIVPSILVLLASYFIIEKICSKNEDEFDATEESD
jgi:hypothetical protein